MKVFDLTYIRYPDSLTGVIFASASLLPLFVIFSLVPTALFARKLSPLVLLLGVVFSTAINEILKRLFRQPRPIDSHRDGFGMPSDHSQFCAFWTAYFLVILASNPKIHKSVVIAATGLNAGVSALVMTSRVFLGVHSVAQVLVGAGIGTILGFLWGRLSETLFAHKKYIKTEKYLTSTLNQLVFIDKGQ